MPLVPFLSQVVTVGIAWDPVPPPEGLVPYQEEGVVLFLEADVLLGRDVVPLCEEDL